LFWRANKEIFYILYKKGICMKTKYLVIATTFALLNIGCSDKNENLQKEREEDVLIENKKNLPARLLKDEYEQFDLNELGVSSFLSAEKEFSAKWNYTGNKKMLKRVIDKICRTERRCAPRVDSVAYRSDVLFILDSLMQSRRLDSLIVDIEQRDYNRSNPVEHEKEVKKILDSLLKNRRKEDSL